MAENDYFFKYKKYKKKYIKQKNLQIGGAKITINIFVREQRIQATLPESFPSQKFESTMTIKEALDTWLIQKNKHFEDYTVFVNLTKDNFKTQPNLDKNKNFDYNNVKNNDKIYIFRLYPSEEAVPYD